MGAATVDAGVISCDADRALVDIRAIFQDISMLDLGTVPGRGARSRGDLMHAGLFNVYCLEPGRYESRYFERTEATRPKNS